MRNKRFTLVEIVSVIFILTLLLSIVLIKYNDFKKKSVYSAVSSNVKILQSAVDTYYLKNEKYPTKKATTLSNPQLVDVDLLVEEKLIKKGLDLKKINSQNYWVDVFGRVWGATEMHPTSINVLESNDKKTFEFTLEGDVSKYKIYEVKGYSQTNYVSYKEVDIQKPNKRVALADGVDKYYRLVKSVDVEGKAKPLSDSFTTLNKDSIYLISIEDEFGLETVPYGLSDNNAFEPLISFEGVREFEIEGTKNMKWIDFYTIEKKPEGSSITYRFKVKNSNGVYGDWSDDFYSLETSKGIVVEITMKANSQKEKPSLYDLRVIYEFEGGQKTKYIPNPPLILPAGELDPIYPNGGLISKGGGSIEVPQSGITNEEDGTILNPPKQNNPADGSSGDSGNNNPPKEDSPADSGSGDSGTGGNGSGGSGVNPPKEEIPVDGETDIPNQTRPNVQDICPAGYGVTNIKSDGTAIDKSKEKQISYLFLIQINEMIGKITPPLIENGKIVNTVIQYSEVNTDNPYVKTDFVRGIPTPACINLLYTIENEGPIEIPTPPSIEITEPIKVEKPKEDAVSEWTTVDKTMFIGRSNTNKPVKWTGFEKDEVIHENTRILYHFSYFKDEREWSEEFEDVLELPLSTTAKVTASLQVKTSKLKNPEQKHPELSKMKLTYDGGIETEPISKPMVLITPSKDNNKERMIFSTTSNISWDIWTFDPYGYDIVNVEWEGDKKDRYEKAGIYEVRVRVQNSEGAWSNWDSYEFNVYEEKPVASLKVEKAYIKINEPVNWDNLIFDLSYDPDQDGELERKWAGNIKEIYTEEDLGEIEVKLQVKDAEGNLSDWVTQKVVIYDDMLWLNAGPYAYDDKITTNEPINTRQQIYWLQDLTNRKVTVNLTTNAGAGGLIYVLDAEGNILNFINASNNFTTNTLNYSGSIRNREYSFIIPKDAYSIQFIAYSYTALNEIYVNVDEPLPNEVVDISTESSEHKTKLNFNSNNLKVNVYSDGKYLNSTTTSSYTRESLLPSTSHNYELEVEDSHGNRSDRVSVSAETTAYDITFYESTVSAANSSLVGMFDYDIGTKGTVSKNMSLKPLTIKWKVKEGVDFPENIEGQVIRLYASSDNNLNYGAFRVVDKEGNALEYDSFYNNKIFKGSRTFLTTSNIYYDIVLPENAVALEFYGNNNYYSNINIMDIRFVGLNSEVSLIEDIKFTPNYNNVSISWTKPDDVSIIDIYRDGVHVGQSTNNQFVDKDLLESNKTYKYSFMVRNEYNISKRIDPIEVKTLERDITFYDNSSLNRTTQMLASFDYDTSSVSKIYINNSIEPLKVKWKVKEGVEFPENIEGQVIRVFASSNDTSNYGAFRVIDKWGNGIRYNLLKGDRLVEYSATYLSTSQSSYDIILPKNADAIEFYGASNNYTHINLFDIQFRGLNSEVSLIEDIQFTPSYNNVSMIWTKPENVKVVEIYRDGVYVGQSTGSSYQDNSILESNKIYKYSFIVRNKENVSKWITPVEVKTLERDIVFFDASSLNRTSQFAAWFDYNEGTNSSIYFNQSIEPVKVKWNVREGTEFPENIEGQVLKLTLFSSDSNNNASFRVLNKAGNTLSYHLFRGGRLNPTTVTYIGGTRDNYYVVLPKGADSIEIFGNSNHYTTTYLIDIQFMGLNSEVSPIENIEFTPNYNAVSMSWTKTDNVKAIEVYRDGTYVGQSTGTTFEDTNLLESNKTYKYTFVMRNEYNVSKWIEPIEVTTLERDVIFYEGSSINRTSSLLAVFDYDASTRSSISLNEISEPVKLKWKVKEGAEFPEEIEGQVIKLYAYNGASNNYISFRVVDKNGNSLKYNLFNGSKLNETNSTYISSTPSNYTIVLPKGAEAIEIYGNSRNTSTVFINDVQFVGLNSEISEIEDIQFTPNYNKVSISWTKPDNVKAVEIYRDGKNIGQSTGTTYVDTEVLESNKTYKYSFVTRNEYNVSKWTAPIEVTTLERDIIFYEASPLNRTTSLAKSFDYDPNTNGNFNINQNIEPYRVKWKVKDGLDFPENTEGQVLRVYAYSSFNNAASFRVVDKNGSQLNYNLLTTNRLVETSSTVIHTSLTYYDIVLPKGAEAIDFYGNNKNSANVYLFDIQFIGLGSQVSPLEDIEFTPNYNTISMNWTKSENVKVVEIYRNGVYVGQTSGANFTDLGPLESNKTYTYSFIVRNEHLISKWSPLSEVTTLERDIIFYEGSTLNRTTQFAGAFDYNPSTRSSMSINNSVNPIKVKWKVKDGVDFPENTKGKTLQVIAYSTYNNYLAFRIVDKNGLVLSYNLSNSGTMVNSTLLTTAFTTYKIVLPENADAIEFYGVGKNAADIQLYDIQFVD